MNWKYAGLIGAGFLTGALLSLHLPAIADREGRAGLPVEELRTFAEVFNAVKQGYVEPVEDRTLITSAISGMLSNLDPHSAYLDAEAFKELQVGTHGEFGGLGIEVGMEDGFVKVISPIEDTPAFRAGLKAGDLIIKIDDTLVKGLTLNDAVKRMRGKPDTRIRLTISRKGEGAPFEVTLTREVIKVRSVRSKLIEPGYGFLRITQFQDNTVESMVSQLKGLTKDGPLKGLVLDLRNDPGGLLHAAVGVSAAFLPAEAKIVSTDGRTEDARREYRAVPADYMRGDGRDRLADLPPEFKKLPMVVLVNGGSASASEIVAGALQDHKRAVILGTQTFGKGSVQTVLPLPGNAAIKLTTARYFTPSGRSIQAKGITPDIIVEEPRLGDGSPHAIREADLTRHLEDKDEGRAAPAKPADRPPVKRDEDEGAPRARFEFGGDTDGQLQQAINLLKGLQIMQARP
jgi:carboxyl-terminal processing protease